jgi:DNA-binding NtrC family response regulator/pSer/pThr/pTyr-binding forkhead associated (FHA) protein
MHPAGTPDARVVRMRARFAIALHHAIAARNFVNPLQDSSYTARVLEVVSSPLYRLRGAIDSRETTIDLHEGRHAVGNSRKSDIRVQAVGVSRQHAVLEVNRAGVVVEDLGSTNGTWIDGVRVERSEVPVGAELRLGDVRLRVEAVASEEDRLAIVLERMPAAFERSTALSVFDDSTLIVGADGSGQASLWLICVEEFVERLQAGRGDDLTPALAYLGSALMAAGCCVAQWTEHGEPLALGSWGELHECPSHAEARRVTGGDDGHGAGFFDTDPPLSIAVSTRAGRAVLGLMVWGEYPGRLSSRRLLQVLLRIIEHSRRAAVDIGPREPVRSAQHPDLVFPPGYRPGTAPVMAALYQQMRALLRGDLPVLISGETGVGKEMVARILHESSDRAEQPFVAINCAAIPSELLEAEMFGIERGVATGVEARPGKFQLAQGGTLFLDEIGEMAPALQAKLLRALQQKEIHPVGGRPRASDVRVLAATNVDLARRIGEGALRSDLYYRLAGCLLEVPPLRSCADDIPALVEHFLRRFATEVGVGVRGLTMRALRMLSSYDWPGNIRELEHVIRRMVYMCSDGEVLDIRHLPRWLHQERPAVDPVARLIAELPSLELKPVIEAIERGLIVEAIRRASGKKVEMCKLLDLSRNGLDKKLERYAIEIEVEGKPS